jgi:hypothetical protein
MTEPATDPALPTEPKPTRRVWVLVAAAVAAFAAAAIMIVVSVNSEPDHVVDETAWRHAREAQGTEFLDWRKYADSWLNNVCTDEDFGIFVAARLDDGVTETQLRTDFTYACPNRLPDFDREIAELKDPCAGMDAEAREQFEEAVGSGYHC